VAGINPLPSILGVVMKELLGRLGNAQLAETVRQRQSENGQAFDMTVQDLQKLAI
jgi:hypothetical protein